MADELDVLRIIGERLKSASIPFMLTGSFALGYYGKPRMTRDLDFVVALIVQQVEKLVSAFSDDDESSWNLQEYLPGLRAEKT